MHNNNIMKKKSGGQNISCHCISVSWIVCISGSVPSYLCGQLFFFISPGFGGGKSISVACESGTAGV